MNSVMTALIIILFAQKMLDEYLNTKYMKLTTDEKEIQLDSTRDNFSIHLKLFNNTNNDYTIYEFRNTWTDCDYDPFNFAQCLSGINIEIRDINGEKKYMTDITSDNDPNINKALLDGKFDSVSQWIKDKYGDEKGFKGQEKLVADRIVESRILLKADSSITIILNVFLDDYYLPKGEYYLYIYYVINNQIFDYIDKNTSPNNLFFGFVKTDSIRLIVM